MNDDKDNRFPINKYLGPEYFCDRESETQKLIEALSNGRNTVLMAPRRLGKTGLVHHVFHEILSKKNKAITIYVDIYSARNINEFNGLLLAAATEAMASSSSQVLETIGKFFKSIRPVVSFDSFTGAPQISLTADSTATAKKDLGEILKTLDALGKPVFIAIDEFQQIETFPEKADAILRTYIQQSKNLSFVFSGSQKHLLLPIFSDPKRPFYASTDFLYLDKIERAIYADFIVEQFKKGGRHILPDDAGFILDWCRRHTYYVQVICNKVYSTGAKKVTHDIILDVMMSTIREQDAVMASIKAMLSKNQWELFLAISREDEIRSYTSKDFIHKYQLSSSAAIIQSLKALEDKEMIYISRYDQKTERAIYEPYNVFYAKWVKHRKAIS